MPQKKNPTSPNSSAATGRLLGAATLATLIKGLPSPTTKTYRKARSPVFDAADTIAGILSVLPAFTASLKFRSTR
jgi:argininosuccinate lyase